MSTGVTYNALEDDYITSKEKKKCAFPHFMFGDIEVGPNKVILPRKYLEFSQTIFDFEVRPDDVWVISFPRSGTTWTQELVWLLGNNLDFETAKNEKLSRRFRNYEFEVFTDAKLMLEHEGVLNSIASLPSPRFIKTHLPVELLPKKLWTVKPKMFYIYRNPKDVVISQYHFYKLMAKYNGDLNDFAEIFLNNRCLYAPYWNHIINYWKIRRQYNIQFLTYEEMKLNLASVISQVANYFGVSITSDEVELLSHHLDVKNMKQNNAVNMAKLMVETGKVDKEEEANFIRTGISGQWKTILNTKLIEKYDEWSKRHINGTDFPYYF